MRINLALANLLHNPPKTFLSMAGIGTAVMLMFVQLGFRGAVENTANMIFARMDFDCVVRSADYLHFVDSREIPRSILDEVNSLPDVEAVVPFHVTLGRWRHPQGESLRNIMVMGLNPLHSPFRDPQRAFQAEFDKLNSPEFVLIDQQSHREFGPRNKRRFSQEDIGVITGLSEKQVKIVGLYDLGAGLTANGSIITSEAGFARLFPRDVSEKVSLAFIRLKPAANMKAFVAQLQQRFQSPEGMPTVTVLSRQQVFEQERQRWIGETPIGFIFTLGVLISFVVGTAIVYMVLATDVSNRLGEYATLKAMGYSNGYLSWVVVRQAIYLAIVSYVPAVLASWTFYQITASLANIPIFMTSFRLWVVFGLTLLMCTLSGILAVRKLWLAQPAELF